MGLFNLLFPWRRLKQRDDETREEINKALEHSKQIHEKVVSETLKKERHRTAKTILTARQAIRIVRNINGDDR